VRALGALLVALALAGCASAESEPEAGHVEARAEIVRASLRVAESHPPQYFADVVSALPNGCTRFARWVVRRAADVVFVDVFVSVPADPGAMCTMIYGEHESAVPLGADFRPGARYVLDVNGARQEFVAQ
jgi:hypothetical protein